MKNLWFHLMPYKDLPDDFRQRIRPCGSASTRLDGARVHKHYHEYLDELEYAGEVGFDGVCCNEHHQNGYGLMPSPNLIAAALTDDRVVPASYQRFATGIGGPVVTQTIADAGHLVELDQPNQLARRVNALFVDQQF